MNIDYAKGMVSEWLSFKESIRGFFCPLGGCEYIGTGPLHEERFNVCRRIFPEMVGAKINFRISGACPCSWFGDEFVTERAKSFVCGELELFDLEVDHGS